MDASDVLRALDKRWPDTEYLKVREAPQDATRMGRKIDLLVVSLWQSRGFELDAVEVKVSASDWRRELENAAKADWWWRHTHRFWVAVPAALAERVKGELPSTWGLIACSDEAAVVVVKAPKHGAAPLPWPSCIGTMRASADAGINALGRAEQRGYDRGYEDGKRKAEAAGGRDWTKDQLDSLRQTVQEFEQASGITVKGWHGGELGRAVAIVQKWSHDPEWAVDGLKRLAGQVSRQGKELAALAAELQAEIAPAAQAGDS